MWNVRAEWFVMKEWVRIPVMTLVFLSKILNYNFFSSPMGKWEHVRAKILLGIDFNLVCYILGSTGCLLHKEPSWLKGFGYFFKISIDLH